MEIDDYIVATDSKLVDLASQGDQQAFEHLYTRYHEAIMRLFEVRLAGDKEAAEDLVQETFIKVYLHLDAYAEEYTFGQWVYTIARNTMVDYLRRRTDDVSIDSAARAPIAPIATTPTPEESVIQSQRRTHVEDSLAELSDDYRRIIELRFIDEYSYEEIADKLGRPINTIKTQIRRAKAAVSKMILEKE